MKKNNKLVTILLASSLLLPGIAPLATGVTSVSAQQGTEIVDRTFDAKYVTVIGQVLRNVPNDQSSTNGYVAAEETVEFVRAIRSSDGKSWFEVKYDDKQGYVLSGDVTSVDNFNDDSEAEIHNVPVTQEAGAKAEYVIASTTALRTKDENNYRPVRVMDKGERVSYKGTTANDWFMVEDKDGQLGYIYRGDVTSVKNFEEEGIVDIQDAEMGTAEDFDQLEVVLDVSLRSFDESNYRPIMDLQRGDIVDYVGTTVKDWFKVKTESGQVGYVYRGHVTAVEEEEALAVESVSAINAKTLEVTFNNPVSAEDQKDAEFDVKRGSFATSVEATWVEDGKSVELARNTNLVAGDYTVTVTGLSDEALSGSTTVEAQKVSDLAISTENIEAKNGVKVVYTATDQYGEEIDVAANAIQWTIVNKTNSSRAVAPVVTADELKLNADDTKVDDVLRVTGLLKSDASVKVTKDITVSDIVLADFELNKVVLPKDEERLNEKSSQQTVELEYSAVDNFGKEMTLTDSENSGIKFISSNEDLVKTIKFDNKGKLEFKIESGKSGKTNITALNPNTGETSTIEVEVFAESEATTVEFGEWKENSVISGDKNGTAKLAVTFLDQYGEEIKAEDATSALGKFNTTITGAGELETEGLVIDEKELYLTFKDSTADKGSYGLTLVNKKTGKTATTNIVVNEARTPAELVVKEAPDASVTESKTTKVEFEVKDQYGKKMKHEDALTSINDVEYTLEAKESDEDLERLDVSISNYTATIKGLDGETGKETVTFELIATDENGNARVVDNQAFEIEVISAITALDVSVDKEEYSAGDDIEVTVKAQKGGKTYADYNKSGVATVTIQGKDYLRNITFKNGVATLSVPAKSATAKDTPIKLTVAFDNQDNQDSNVFEIKGVEPSKLATNDSDEVIVVDEFGNEADYDFTGLATVTNVNGNLTNLTLDAEKKVQVKIVDGKITNTDGTAVIFVPKVVSKDSSLTLTLSNGDEFTVSIEGTQSTENIINGNGAYNGNLSLTAEASDSPVIYGPEDGLTKTINGDVTITGDAPSINLRNVNITGTLTLDTPNAHVVVSAETDVNAISVKDISRTSLEILGTVNSVVVNTKEPVRVYGKGLATTDGSGHVTKIISGPEAEGQAKVILAKNGTEATSVSEEGIKVKKVDASGKADSVVTNTEDEKPVQTDKEIVAAKETLKSAVKTAATAEAGKGVDYQNVSEKLTLAVAEDDLTVTMGLTLTNNGGDPKNIARIAKNSAIAEAELSAEDVDKVIESSKEKIADALKEYQTNTVARYVGLLNGNGVEEIKFNEVTYIWKESLEYKGSKWTDKDGKTLMSVLATKIDGDFSLEIADENGISQTMTIGFDSEITEEIKTEINTRIKAFVNHDLGVE